MTNNQQTVTFLSVIEVTLQHSEYHSRIPHRAFQLRSQVYYLSCVFQSEGQERWFFHNLLGII